MQMHSKETQKINHVEFPVTLYLLSLHSVVTVMEFLGAQGKTREIFIKGFFDTGGSMLTCFFSPDTLKNSTTVYKLTFKEMSVEL